PSPRSAQCGACCARNLPGIPPSGASPPGASSCQCPPPLARIRRPIYSYLEADSEERAAQRRMRPRMDPDKPIPMVSIPSHLAYVNCLRGFVVGVCKMYGLDDTTTDGIALAVHEAVTNIIRHSHQHDLGKLIQLTCEVQPD